MVRAVHHGEGTRQLKELVRGYETICRDNQRTMARIKAIFRARGIRTPGRNVYQAKQREQWLQQLGTSLACDSASVGYMNNWII